jgi:hypothetical protein
MPRVAGRIPSINGLLARLTIRELRRFVGRCEQVALVERGVLFEPGEQLSHVYFPAQGYLTLAASCDRVRWLNVGLIGTEGMLGLPLVMGFTETRLQSRVQGAAFALRMDWLPFVRNSAEARHCSQSSTDTSLCDSVNVRRPSHAHAFIQ